LEKNETLLNKTLDLKDRGVCIACCSSFAISQMHSLPCQHRLCSDDLKSFVSSAYQTKSFPLKCPFDGCETEIPDEVAFLCMDQQDSENYTRNAVISGLENVIYCPNSKCSLPFEYDDGNVLQEIPVQCPSCHYQFCKKCRFEAHLNLTCEQRQEQIHNADEEGKKQLLELAKMNKWQGCQCGYVFEKVNGCNHMTCRCRREWCYTCGKHFTDLHAKGYHCENKSCHCPQQHYSESHVLYSEKDVMY